MPEVLIAIGSNLGDRMAHLRDAVAALAGSVRVTACSRVYETAPMYEENQPAFFNAALRGRTELGPIRLLQALKAVERELGRQQRIRNGPREIDLDIVAYGRLRYLRHGVLEIPHPRAAERPFVLHPLMDIAPEWNLPGQGVVAHLVSKTNGDVGNVVTIVDGHLPVHR